MNDLFKSKIENQTVNELLIYTNTLEHVNVFRNLANDFCLDLKLTAGKNAFFKEKFVTVKDQGSNNTPIEQAIINSLFKSGELEIGDGLIQYQLAFMVGDKAFVQYAEIIPIKTDDERNVLTIDNVITAMTIAWSRVYIQLMNFGCAKIHEMSVQQNIIQQPTYNYLHNG